MARNSETEQKTCPEWEGLFLEELVKQGSVFHACTHAKVGRTTVYRHRKECATLREKWDEATERATDLLEQSVYDRATNGWEEPVFFKGEQCGTVRKFSNSLAIFLLKTRRPERYNIQTGETGNEGSAVDRAAELRNALDDMRASVPVEAA